MSETSELRERLKPMQEPLTDEFISIIRMDWSNDDIFTSHWHGCETSHACCAVVRLCDEVMRLRRELAKYERQETHGD